MIAGAEQGQGFTRNPLERLGLSFPTRATRAIGNPEIHLTRMSRLWIPGQAFGLPGMTPSKRMVQPESVSLVPHADQIADDFELQIGDGVMSVLFHIGAKHGVEVA